MSKTNTVSPVKTCCTTALWAPILIFSYYSLLSSGLLQNHIQMLKDPPLEFSLEDQIIRSLGGITLKSQNLVHCSDSFFSFRFFVQREAVTHKKK